MQPTPDISENNSVQNQNTCVGSQVALSNVTKPAEVTRLAITTQTRYMATLPHLNVQVLAYKVTS